MTVAWVALLAWAWLAVAVVVEAQAAYAVAIAYPPPRRQRCSYITNEAECERGCGDGGTRSHSQGEEGCEENQGRGAQRQD